MPVGFSPAKFSSSVTCVEEADGLSPTRRWFLQATEKEQSRKTENAHKEMTLWMAVQGGRGDRNDTGVSGLEDKMRSRNHYKGSH